LVEVVKVTWQDFRGDERFNAAAMRLWGQQFAMRCYFASVDEPSPAIRVPHMLWLRTTDHHLVQRNADDTAWLEIFRQWVQCGEPTDLSGGRERGGPMLWDVLDIEMFVFVCATSYDGDSGNHWRFRLKYYDEGADGNMLSSDVLTYTGAEIPGIGGGPIVANTPYVIRPDQNSTVRLSESAYAWEVGKIGSPTTLEQPTQVFAIIPRFE
jgi:hypothetical protein